MPGEEPGRETRRGLQGTPVARQSRFHDGRLAALGLRDAGATAMTPPLLEVKNLRVEFPTRRGTLLALDDISFDIAPGEILGVVGESGAGKSLTGAAIIGLLEPPGRIASGEILLAGQRIDSLPYEQMRAIRGRKIGAIFQDPLTSLTGRWVRMVSVSWRPIVYSGLSEVSGSWKMAPFLRPRMARICS